MGAVPAVPARVCSCSVGADPAIPGLQLLRGDRSSHLVSVRGPVKLSTAGTLDSWSAWKLRQMPIHPAPNGVWKQLSGWCGFQFRRLHPTPRATPGGAACFAPQRSSICGSAMWGFRWPAWGWSERTWRAEAVATKRFILGSLNKGCSPCTPGAGARRAFLSRREQSVLCHNCGVDLRPWRSN